MLTEKQIAQIREELESCKRPLFLFHDDADGLCSFLLLYRMIREGKGIVVKTTPKIDAKFINKVTDYEADKVFILDIAIVEQEFIDAVKVPIIWIDHHEPLERTGVKYFNPRKENRKDNFPASYLCYSVAEDDLWIAMCGIVGDWFMPEFSHKFSEKYPDLLPENITKPDDALFETQLGKLIKIISFNLKGKTTEVNKSLKILTRIKTPYEILKKETSAGNFIYKKYEQANMEYEILLTEALASKQEEKDDFFIYTYASNRMSLSGELANEMFHRFPGRTVIIGRKKSGEMKCSLRSGKTISAALKKALVGIDGYGGGHEHACGCCVKINDFKKFIGNLKRELSKDL